MKPLRGLRWRTVLLYSLLVSLFVGMAAFYVSDLAGDSYLSNLEERSRREAGLAAEVVSPYFGGSPDPAALQAAVERIGAAADGWVTIIARDGTVLAGALESAASVEGYAGQPEVRSALDSGVGQSVRFSTTADQELLYTAAPIQAGGEAVGVALLTVPTSPAQADMRRARTAIVLSLLAVALLSLAAGYLLTRRTSRAMRAITEGARRLTAGDLEHRVGLPAADGSQELAAAFNRMAAVLRDMVQDLADERNRLTAVLNTMADGVVLVQSDGQIALINEAAGDLLGLREQLVVGRRFMEQVRDYQLQQLTAGALESGEQRLEQLELLPSHRYISAIATPLTGGVQRGVLLTLHDMTLTRQIETTRREFVSNVSHELRNPLASIKAIAETLEVGGLQDQRVALDFVQRIHQEVDRMTRMVEDLLALSRLESERAEVHTDVVDLLGLISSVIESFLLQAQAKAVTIESTAPAETLRVRGEEEKLRQVLANLVSNALKFTPSGGAVNVVAKRSGADVQVSVIDTGTGIPEEHLPHVFERFYKVDRSRHGSGAGLGLAIVKHIVQAHGGEVSAASEEGKGSTFAFTVPSAD